MKSLMLFAISNANNSMRLSHNRRNAIVKSVVSAYLHDDGIHPHCLRTFNTVRSYWVHHNDCGWGISVYAPGSLSSLQQPRGNCYSQAYPIVHLHLKNNANLA